MKLPGSLLIPLLLWPGSVHGQTLGPPEPIAPSTMAQCDKFAAEYEKHEQQLSAAHDACLKAHKSPGAASNPKIIEPVETCSRPECQKLHTQMYSARSTGAAKVNACRQQVQAKLDEQARRKQQQEAQQKRLLDEKEQADELKSMKAEGDKQDKKTAAENKQAKAYGDEQQRTQAARDASARKEAEETDAWHKKHDQLMEQQRQKRDQEAAEKEQQKEARDQRLGLDDYSAQHAAWQQRENARKAQLLKLQEEPANIEDEQQRHAALQQALLQMKQINDERKRDPEPKSK
jgi:hypothetical protein